MEKPRLGGDKRYSQSFTLRELDSNQGLSDPNAKLLTVASLSDVPGLNFLGQDGESQKMQKDPQGARTMTRGRMV